MPFLALVFLHVATSFAVIAIHSGSMALVVAAVWAREDDAAAAVARLYGRAGRLVPPLGLLAGAFGLLAALSASYNLAAPWLLLAYGLFVAMIAFGGAVSVPAMASVAGSGSDAPTHRSGRRSRLAAIVAVDTAIVVLLIADMVVKPFS
ncbi:MAG: hypothetical protein IT305_06305 [Chloroflexi bacterium]|nr:hypothetical protein [Chloroflexota bacterium]